MELQLFIVFILAVNNAHTIVIDVNRQSYEELLLSLTHDSKRSEDLAQHYKPFGHIVYAGNGIKATTVLGLHTQYRGMSWSIGGDENAMTMPNILRRYNPHLKGVSLMTGSVTSDIAHLNRAIPGSTSERLLKQAKDLVQHMKSEYGDVYETDWKVVTILVGANNICNSCDNPEKYAAVQYVRDVKSALDYLHSYMPRTFVNLVQMANVTAIRFSGGYICTLLKIYLCNCVENTSDPPAINKLVKDYHEGLNNLVNSGRYNTTSDFAVVIQPFFMDGQLPLEPNGSKVDLSYFAPDCFHFSQTGEAELAISLWNNMMQPVGSKQTDWTTSTRFICPNAVFDTISLV